MYKTSNNGSFKWDIDQACTLVPADIVACNSQFEPSPDPALEKIAEEANERYVYVFSFKYTDNFIMIMYYNFMSSILKRLTFRPEI